jgi:signal recognition particle receptor subunit beta
MGKVSDSARLVSLKIVYFGAAGVGKTTNLERLRSKTSTEAHPSDLISLDHEGDRTLMFDWTPLRAGHGAAYDVRLQVYAVPGKPKQESTKRRLLRDADGIVFILDSGPDKLGENRTAWQELSEHLQALGLNRDRVPLVIQLNKRDLPHAMQGDDLRARLGMGGYPIVEAVAKGAAGVGATLLDITRRAIRTLSDVSRTGGGEPLSLAEISRIESTGLPEAFSACGLLPRRVKHTPGPVAAEEFGASSSHRSHDSPRAASGSDAAPSKPRSEPRPIDREAGKKATGPAEHATQRLMPAALLKLPHIDSATNFTPAPRAERHDRPLLTPLSPGGSRAAVPEEAVGLPLVGAHTAAGLDAGNTALADQQSQPTLQPSGLVEPPKDGSDIRRVGRAAPDKSTVTPPRVKVTDLRDTDETPEAEEMAKTVRESEARVMARLAQVEEQIADLRGLLLQVSEQVRRVSTAPPESEARLTKLVRDALGQVELTMKVK